jgi:hydrogenase nickel incorporation protein HypA/HybF
MHEISIAQSIIEIAEATAREAHCRSIQVIALRLGEFTSIVREALEFAFEASKQGTMAENARLKIEVAPMVVQCVVCDVEVRSAMGRSLICSQCGFPLKLISGEELLIEYVELEEEERDLYRPDLLSSADQRTHGSGP